MHTFSLCWPSDLALYLSSCLLLTSARDVVRGKETLLSNIEVLSTSHLTSQQPYIRLVLLNPFKDEKYKAETGIAQNHLTIRQK